MSQILDPTLILRQRLRISPLVQWPWHPLCTRAPRRVRGRSSPPRSRSAAPFFLKARQTAHARVHRRLVQLVQQQQQLVGDIAMTSQSCPRERRTVLRAIGAWRGSSTAGYLRDGDDQTYLENFRCTRSRFDALVANLKDSLLDGEVKQPGTTDWRKAQCIVEARAVIDPPNRRFKVAACLYAIGQGGLLS